MTSQPDRATRLRQAMARESERCGRLVELDRLIGIRGGKRRARLYLDGQLRGLRRRSG